MTTRGSNNPRTVVNQLQRSVSGPNETALSDSRKRVRSWFAEQAPLIQWGEMISPLGQLFVAVSGRGLCAVDFGRDESDFLDRLDPQAQLERNSEAVEHVITQLREYFTGDRSNFNLPIDISQLTPFHRTVLEVTCRITRGQVWTYRRVAEELGRPHCSRPVGQALARNPVPIVIPCHRVIATNGSLHGYSGGSGLKAKRWLLELEGALKEIANHK